MGYQLPTHVFEGCPQMGLAVHRPKNEPTVQSAAYLEKAGTDRKLRRRAFGVAVSCAVSVGGGIRGDTVKTVRLDVDDEVRVGRSSRMATERGSHMVGVEAVRGLAVGDDEPVLSSDAGQVRSIP